LPEVERNHFQLSILSFFFVFCELIIKKQQANCRQLEMDKEIKLKETETKR